MLFDLRPLAFCEIPYDSSVAGRKFTSGMRLAESKGETEGCAPRHNALPAEHRMEWLI
jgi:hypothetical protein